VSMGMPSTATSAPSSLSQSAQAGWRAEGPCPTKGISMRSGVLRVGKTVVMVFAPSGDVVRGLGSADLLGDAFGRVGALDRRAGDHGVEQLGDMRARARRGGHRARPAGEHGEVEIGGADLRAEEEWAVRGEMGLDDIEEGAGAGFGTLFDDGDGWRVVAG